MPGGAHKSFGNVNPNLKPAIAEEDEDDNYSDNYDEGQGGDERSASRGAVAMERKPLQKQQQQ